MDLALVESLSGQSCDQVQAIADGGRCCSFRVQAAAEERSTKPEMVDLIV